MGRPLFIFCLLTTACIWMGCRLDIFSNGKEQVSQGRELLLQEEAVLIQGRVYEQDSESIYLESIEIMKAAPGQQGEYQSIPASSPVSFTIPKKIKIKCEYSLQEHGKQPKLGSTVLVTGDFVAFSAARNPGQFDARNYYEGQNICGKLQDCRVLQESEDYSFLLEGLRQLRQECSDRIYRLLPAKEASVLNTILLGEKRAMDGELKELYREAGILHIASISGLHVMLIAMFLLGLLRRLGAPLWLAGISSSILLMLYGVMTGMSTSAVRAIAMFLIRMLGMVLGRTYDMLTALGLVGMLMVACHPAYLQDAGFLLSFGAVLGIGILQPALKTKEQWRLVRRRFLPSTLVWLGKRGGKSLQGVVDAFRNGMAVKLALLPTLLWYYYEIPVYSWVLNLLIIPSISVLTVVGFGMMLLPTLAFLAPLEQELLQLYTRLSLWTLEWPAHTWNPGRPEVWTVVVYYLLVVLAIVLRSKKFFDWMNQISSRRCSKTKLMGGILGCARVLPLVFLVAGICLLGYHPREMGVTFLDVGQGDCICVETASGQVYLFDCGSSSESKVGQYVLKPYLKYYGIDEIDGLFLSHPDSDHCNGALELLTHQQDWGIRVRQVVLPDASGADSKRLNDKAQIMGMVDGKQMLQAGGRELTSQKWKDIWAVAGCPVVYVSAGHIAMTDDIRLTCLHPRPNHDYEDGNQASQCFYLEVGGDKQNPLRVLLTGDVEGDGEVQLLETLRHYGISRVDVLKVAHHGSKNGTSEEFLKQIDAEIAVISCGERNVYGHPHAETLERLTRDGAVIMTTSERGAVNVQKGQVLDVQTWQSPTKDRK